MRIMKDKMGKEADNQMETYTGCWVQRLVRVGLKGFDWRMFLKMRVPLTKKPQVKGTLIMGAPNQGTSRGIC